MLGFVSKLTVPGFERLHEPSAALSCIDLLANMPASDALRQSLESYGATSARRAHILHRGFFENARSIQKNPTK